MVRTMLVRSPHGRTSPRREAWSPSVIEKVPDTFSPVNRAIEPGLGDWLSHPFAQFP
jgi:hypothetical protein